MALNDLNGGLEPGGFRTYNFIPAEKTIDDFEDNDIAEYTGNTGPFDVVSTTAFEGTYSLKGSSGGSLATIVSTSGLNAYPAQGDTIDYRAYTTDTDPAGTGGDSARAGMLFGVTESGGNISDGYGAINNYADDNIQLQKFSGGGRSGLNSTTIDWSSYNSEWIRGEIEWDSTITYTVYDDAGTVIDTVSASDSSYTSGGIGWYINAAGNGSCFYDDALF